jgi:transposase
LRTGRAQQYSSGAVEGTVDKIKARKTLLVGPAKHDLLKNLVLLS